MEKVNLGYSVKNIPLAYGGTYKLKLVEKIESVIKRMRWKAIFFTARNKDTPEIETYGLPTEKCPQQVKELIQFENEVFQLAKNVQFKKVNNPFQTRMKEDAQKMRNSGKTLTPADETTNFYRQSADE